MRLIAAGFAGWLHRICIVECGARTGSMESGTEQYRSHSQLYRDWYRNGGDGHQPDRGCASGFEIGIPAVHAQIL